MKYLFSSKEAPFFQTDSDLELAGPPAEYLSDLVDAPSKESTAFIRRLKTAKIPETGFVCAVIRVADSPCQTDRDKATDCFESTFQCVFQPSAGKGKKKSAKTNASSAKKTKASLRGIWESLGQGIFVLAFWDYKKKPQAKKLLESLKKNLGTALGRGVLMGRAWYPFEDFSVPQTFYNALKALDHAAFFNDNYVQDFDGVSLNISGDRKFQFCEYEAAIKEYQAGLLLDPHNMNLMNSLGVCFGVANELEKAEEQFQKALDRSPEDIMVLYNMGLVHHIQENGKKAIVYLTKAHGINPDIYEVELLLGRLFYGTGQNAKALKYLEKATALKPESSTAFRLQGEIFLAQDKPAEAGRAFNQAVKRNPQDAASLSGYAQAMAAQGKNLQIALSFARQSLALEPGNSLFAKRLTRILHLQGNGAKEGLTGM